LVKGAKPPQRRLTKIINVLVQRRYPVGVDQQGFDGVSSALDE
jgi:hypothetical protein